MRNVLLLIFVQIGLILNAQENIPIDSWRSHFSYNKAIQVYAFDDITYVVSENGLFYYDKNDGSVTTFSKINGLSEDNISAIGYDQVSNRLLIGYTSGNLDVISESEMVFFDLNLNSQVLGSKKINHITTLNSSAFLSTDYGILNFNLDKLEIRETYRQLGANAEQIRVNQSVILGDSLFLATEKGILSSNFNNGTNLLDPISWKRDLITKDVGFISSYSSELLLGVNNEGIYSYSNKVWNFLPTYNDQEIKSLNIDGSEIIIVGNDQLNLIKSDLTIEVVNSNIISKPLSADISNGEIWIADENNGLVTNFTGSFTDILPSGPNTNNIFNFFTRPNVLLALPGGYSSSGFPDNNSSGYNEFTKGFWHSYTGNAGILPEFNDITDATYFDDTGAYYFASFGYGILRLSSSGDVIIFNETNSTLTKASNEENSIYVTSVVNSIEGLWATNYSGTHGLHLYDGTIWQSFSIPTTRVLDLINSTKYLWMIIDPEFGGGILVFDKSSGEYRHLTNASGNGGLPSSSVNSLAIDNDGIVWIGTNTGVATITQSQNLITGVIDAIKPIFENRLLLRDEEVLSIKIDGGNRKWMGTKNGVWLFDKDVNEQLNYFNIDNSPLPSNTINKIDIIPNTGEVFFGTPEGIVSYRSDATQAEQTHNDVKIFPNPVTSDFKGTIGISGLADDVIVKITDSSGRLIWDTRAAGGTASWNTLDYNGRRASSGIYFVFSSSDDGSENFIGKIAIIN